MYSVCVINSSVLFMLLHFGFDRLTMRILKYCASIWNKIEQKWNCVLLALLGIFIVIIKYPNPSNSFDDKWMTENMLPHMIADFPYVRRWSVFSVMGPHACTSVKSTMKYQFFDKAIVYFPIVINSYIFKLFFMCQKWRSYRSRLHLRLHKEYLWFLCIRLVFRFFFFLVCVQLIDFKTSKHDVVKYSFHMYTHRRHGIMNSKSINIAVLEYTNQINKLISLFKQWWNSDASWMRGPRSWIRQSRHFEILIL